MRLKDMMKRLCFFTIFIGAFLSCNPDVLEEIESTEGDDAISNEEELVEIQERPNILLFIADDMSLDATPNYNMGVEDFQGVQKPVMPTLEGLMSTGLVFDNLWSYALCSPTRASILTGKHGVHTDVLAPIHGTLSGTHKSLQTYLDEQTGNAYAHAVFGKWHLGNEATHPTQTMGIDTYSGSLGGGVPDYWEYDLIENEISTFLTSTTDEEKQENYSTTKYTQLAIDWKAQQTKPWFLWVAYNAAHTPFHRPDNNVLDVNSPSRQLPDYDSGNRLPYYLAMLEAMDYEMGRLIASMSAEERANTVIIFIGDNGTPKGVAQYDDTTKHRKGSIYQGGINVPLVVSGPNVRVGRETDALLSTTDLFATIAAIAGVNVDSIHNSKSFKNLLEVGGEGSREYVYVEVPGNNNNGSYAVRNDTYKLIYEIDTGKEELYNLRTDKYETLDLLLEENTAILALDPIALEARVALKAEAERVRGE